MLPLPRLLAIRGSRSLGRRGAVRGPGVLMGPSWRTPTTSGCDMVVDALVLALRGGADVLCHRGTAPA